MRGFNFFEKIEKFKKKVSIKGFFDRNIWRKQMKSNLNNCKQGSHPFEIIASFDNCWHETKVVRWCPECGAVVVDLDYDGITKPGYYKKLQYPNIVYEHGFENE